jgi:hypothetical protein
MTLVDRAQNGRTLVEQFSTQFDDTHTVTAYWSNVYMLGVVSGTCRDGSVRWCVSRLS